MKTFTRTGAVAGLLAIAVVTAAGTTHAETPAAPTVATPPSEWTTTTLAPDIRYQDNTSAATAALRTPFGTVAVGPGRFDIRDATGATVLGTPIEVPAPAEPAAAEPATAVAEDAEDVAAQTQPVAGDQLAADLQQAVAAAAPHMGLAMAVGGLAGSVVGAGLGCPLGIATGGTLISLATAGTMTIPAMVASCLVGVVAVGGLGASVGGVAVAIPVGIAAGTQKFNQLQAEHAHGAAN